MHTMAALLADFILEERAYVNADLDDFTWEGVDVYPLDKAGEQAEMGVFLQQYGGCAESERKHILTGIGPC